MVTRFVRAGWRLGALSLTVWALGACAVLESGVGTGAVVPLGTDWVLTQLGTQAPLAGHVPTLRWEANGQLNGSAGCNRYHGQWSRTADGLQIKTLAMTRMLCQGAVNTQEQAFVQALEKANTLRLQGQSMRLIGPAGSPELHFVRQAGR